MQDSRLLILRADASPQIGAGHVMRCIALGEAWRRQGGDVLFVGRIRVPWVWARLQSEGFRVKELVGDIPQQESPHELLQHVASEAAEWVVLDGYHFGPDCQRAVRKAGYKLLVIDDCNHLPEYSCDLLLNQNVTAKHFAYRGEVAQKLLGTRFALLRREFMKQETDKAIVASRSSINNVLLTLGGGDMMHCLNGIRDFLNSSLLEGKILRVVAAGASVPKWEEALSECRASFEILENVSNMSEQMHWADFCVSAGGSTCWELCATGVPFALVCVADNQRDIVNMLQSAGAACDTSPRTLSKVFASPAIRKAMTNRAVAIVDGKGADRVVVAMHNLGVTLCEAGVLHCDGIWRIVNNPIVRNYFFSKENIPYKEHVNWYYERLKNGLPFYVLLDPVGNIVGYSRFERSEGKTFISVAISPDLQSKGLGCWLIDESTDRFFSTTSDFESVYAYVKRENLASVKAFAKAGYQSDSDDNAVLVLKKERLFCC